MRIAVTIWEDKVSPLLDTANKLLIIDSETQKKVSRFEAFLLERDMSRRCHFIRELNIDVLICGGVSRQLSEMLMAFEIKVVSGISGPAEDVLDAYLKGKLLNSKFFMPGRKNLLYRSNQQLLVLKSAERNGPQKGERNDRRKKSKSRQIGKKG